MPKRKRELKIDTPEERARVEGLWQYCFPPWEWERLKREAAHWNRIEEGPKYAPRKKRIKSSKTT